MRVLLGLPVLLAGTSALGAPVATLATDVDGDGATDRLELEPSGALSIATKKGASTVNLGGSVAAATLSAASVRGVPMIVAQVTRGGAQEAIVLALEGGGWKPIVTTPVGGVGLDADYGVAIAADAQGLYRYQTRPGYRRCDGKPALLFAERFDSGRFRRVSLIPTGVPENAPVLQARADAGAAAAPLLYQARTASYQPGVGDAGGLGIPSELDDGKPATAWREELASDGTGQFFTYEPRGAGAKASEIRIVPGAKGNRVKRIAVVAAQGAWHVDVPDAAGAGADAAYVAHLPAPIDGCVTLVIEATYGAPNGATSIGELEVFGEGERAGGGEAALAHVVASGADGAAAAAQALARRGAAGAAALEAELAKATTDDARARLVRAAIGISDPAAIPLLAHAARERLVHGGDLLAAIGALGTLGAAKELRELADRQELAVEARIAAVHALGSSGKDPSAAIDLAGAGPRELRAAVIEVVTGAPTATLAQAAAAASSPSASGDLWRALTRRAHANAAERPAALAAMVAAFPSASDYERRYRLVDGIAAIGDAGAVAQLADALRAMPAGGDKAAFEQIAARAIAANPRADAFALLLQLVREPDPGVRLAALAALATTEGGPAGPWHAPDGADGVDRVVQTALASDTWPEVRRRAAQVLGSRCARPGPARSLVDAIARDRDLGVRADALAALVDCKAPGTGDVLASIWDSDKAPLELRQRAIDLTVPLGDAAVAARLVGKLRAWRGAALESADALALVQNAAYAIGRLAPPGAGDALIDALDDTAYPEIVAAAATGLGLMGKACPAAAHGKLKALSHADEQQIQIAARRAAAQCGK